MFVTSFLFWIFDDVEKAHKNKVKNWTQWRCTTTTNKKKCKRKYREIDKVGRQAGIDVPRNTIVNKIDYMDEIEALF